MSLDRAYDDDNVFARILRGDLPAAKLYEDDAVLAFMDAYPQTEGHCLVIPKDVHAVNLLDLPTEALHRVIAKVQVIAGAVVDALTPSGFRVVQFNGASAGQSVFHTHFHIIPSYKDRDERPHGSDPVPMAELEATAALIRARL